MALCVIKQEKDENVKFFMKFFVKMIQHLKGNISLRK
jgi:hypothetical protein